MYDLSCAPSFGEYKKQVDQVRRQILDGLDDSYLHISLRKQGDRAIFYMEHVTLVTESKGEALAFASVKQGFEEYLYGDATVEVWEGAGRFFVATKNTTQTEKKPSGCWHLYATIQ